MSIARFVSLASLVVMVTAACSWLTPKSTGPDCGPKIDRGAVRVLDLTAYDMQERLIDDAVRKAVGAYRLMTAEPVWIPKRSATGSNGTPGSIAAVQSVAADWGCDLLLLLDTKMTRNELLVQGRNEEQVWLVHAGRIER